MQKSQILKILPRLLTAGAVPNRTTLSSALSVCGRLRKAFLGPAIHTHIIKSGDQLCKDVSVNSALVFMYSKCAELGSAQKVFKSMPERNVVSWNSIISAHAESNNEADAWGVFVEMLTDGCQPSEVTLTGMATVSPRIAEGRVVHGLVTKLGLAEEITGAAIVEMYVRLESLVDAQKVFDQIPRTEMGSWNAIISGYARNGQAREALDLFNQLRDHTSLRLNSITLGGALTACAALGAFREGKAIHNYAISHNISLDLKLATSLINMYSKCGSVDKAREVFEGMEERDIVAWSVMISGHGVNGQAGEALELFDRMVRDEGLRPDNVAFTAVLSACSHAGMLQEGWEYFNQMKRVYKLEPENEQYACVVDLLGRAGKLDEALGFIEKMPINPSPVAMDAMEEDDSQLPTQIVPAAPPMALVPALAQVPIPLPIAPVPALALLPIPPPIAPIPPPPASLLRARATATAVRPESDSDSDDSPPPPHSAADYEISEASRLARERQEKILQDHLMKRHALAMAVPTKDAEVRARLRRLAEPVTLFGEREMEHRDLLRSLMVRLHSEGQLDHILKAHEEDQEAAAAEDPGEELRYPFFTPGPPELLEARKDIAFYSLQRAMVRLARERRREDRDEDEDVETEYVVNQARQFVLECSEIGDDRPLSGCSFSQDGSMLATRGEGNGSSLAVNPCTKSFSTSCQKSKLQLENGRMGVPKAESSDNAVAARPPAMMGLPSASSNGLFNHIPPTQYEDSPLPKSGERFSTQEKGKNKLVLEIGYLRKSNNEVVVYLTGEVGG